MADDITFVGAEPVDVLCIQRLSEKNFAKLFSESLRMHKTSTGSVPTTPQYTPIIKASNEEGVHGDTPPHAKKAPQAAPTANAAPAPHPRSTATSGPWPHPWATTPRLTDLSL
jgi:hypothetical protein